jgi:hypothetical protein
LRSAEAVVAAGDMRKFCTKVLILRNKQKKVGAVMTISCYPENFLH